MLGDNYSDHMAQAKLVRLRIEGCHACKLGEGTNRVPYGGVSWKPELLILGEAPGVNEDRTRQPFVGQAGKLLDEILGRVGLSRYKVMVANVVCCRPPDNRDPNWVELEACEPNRKNQIDLARTWVGVLMGRVALSSVLGNPSATVGAHKGKPFWDGDMVWVPTYHPAYALRNPAASQEIASHIKKALDLKWGKADPPLPGSSSYQMIDGFLVIDHEGVRVPEGLTPKAVFTKAEWAKMKYSSGDLVRAVMEAKRGLGAEVIL